MPYSGQVDSFGLSIGMKDYSIDLKLLSHVRTNSKLGCSNTITPQGTVEVVCVKSPQLKLFTLNTAESGINTEIAKEQDD